MKNIKLIIWLLAILCLSSCANAGNKRLLNKFVSRFNAHEYSCAATYIYPDDHVQFAFFTKVKALYAPHSFIKVKEVKTVGDQMIVSLKWVNATEDLRRYFLNIGKPLTLDNILKDTLKVRDTMKGKTLEIKWVFPEMRRRNLQIAQISSDTIDKMNIREGPTTKSNVIWQIEKNQDIFIYKESFSEWAECFFITPLQTLRTGYINTPKLDMTDSAYFSLSIFDSMSLLGALLIIAIIAVPLFYIRGIAEAVSQGGCMGVGITIVVVLGLLLVLYQAIEKVLFELLVINLPY